MQIIEQKKQISVKTPVDIFKDEVFRMYTMLKMSHTNLMRVWDNPNAEEIIRGTGTDAKEIFEQSYAIQVILKTADHDYKIITPYKWKIINSARVKVPLQVTFNEDGSVDEFIEVVV